MQKTDFEFNIIVADDCSADDTLDKVKALDKSSDIEFIYLKSEKNLGIKGNYKRAFAACDAEYIAVMEGDDFWTTPLRLQKHVDFLDNHFECVMSTNNRINADYEKSIFYVMPQIPPSSLYKNNDYILVTARDIITHAFCTNYSTCVYRKTAVDRLPSDWWDNPNWTGYEYILNMVICKNGFSGFLLDIMNIRRLHETAHYAGKTYQEQLEISISCLDYDNLLTQNFFEKEIAAHKEKQIAKLEELKCGDVHYKSSNIKRMLRVLWRWTPTVFIWIFKALMPKAIVEKLYGSVAGSGN
jgi:glycosyltransferase involved in cell wall biosynthesis